DHSAVPRVTFTDPEVASVGISEAAAREHGLNVITASADPAETARGYIHDFHDGALKLIADRDRGVLIGATLVTPRAGELLGELVAGVLGAFLGGILAQVFKINFQITGHPLITAMVVAFVGAVILLFLLRMIGFGGRRHE